jgi:transposase
MRSRRAPRIDTKQLDLAGFEAWLRAQLQGSALAAVLVVVLQIVRALFEQNTQLRQRIAGYRSKPPSERLRAVEKQLAFGFAVPQNDIQPTDSTSSEDSGDGPRPKPKRGGSKGSRGTRRPLPKTIATISVPNNVPAEERGCSDCGCEMQRLGKRKSSSFELVPARVEHRVRLDEVIACPRCDAIKRAKTPDGVLDGGSLGPTLVTEALADKVLNSTPIERQARDYQREGVPIAASTLGRSVAALLQEMEPLADRITVKMKACRRIQFDSTGLRVLDPKAFAGVHRDTLWTMIGDGRWIRFAALESGDSDSIEAFICGADAESYQCDGTSVTNFVEKKFGRCRPGCHSHGRRKLVEAVRRGDLRGMDLLRLYQKLFVLEKVATEQKLDASARAKTRQRESAPLMEQIRTMVLALAPEVEPKSPLGAALTYLQRQWMRLCLFLLDGEIELTNNRSERELRPWVLGQHNWLFAGNQRNAERWAAGFSLIHSAIAHGLNPRAYLHAIVPKLIGRHPKQRLDELLPDAILRSHPHLADPSRQPKPPTTDVSDVDAA